MNGKVPRTAPLLAKRLYLTDGKAGELLGHLLAAGIVAESAQERTYTFAPEPALAGMLERLAQLYSSDLVAVTDLIHSTVDRRAFQFADAFRLRKD